MNTNFGIRLLAASLLITVGMAAQAQETVEIKIQLPKPFFGGTPLDYFPPNLEAPSYKDPGPIIAPKGTENVALNKPVTSSKEPNFGKLALITDGNKSYEEKALTEVGPGLQWIQIDLGAVHSIYGIMVWHYHANERVYFDMVVQVSDDPAFKAGVTTVYNADHDNSSGLGAGKEKEYKESFRGRLVTLKDGLKGQYVRFYSKGNTSDEMNHYVEAEVFGVPAS